MIDVNRLKKLMAAKGIAKPSECIGVSTPEIRSLEHHFGVTFPAAYHTYLKHFGRSAGYLSPWMAIYFDDLKEIQENFAVTASKFNKPFAIPPGALFIANWESVFDYIVCGDSENPAVYRIDIHESTEALPHAASFSQYFEDLVAQHGEHIRIEDFGLDEKLIPKGDTIVY